MSESKPPVKKSGSGLLLLLLGILLLLAAAAGVFWKLSQAPEEQVVEERVTAPAASEQAGSGDESVPPPPELAALPSAAPSQTAEPSDKPKGPAGCTSSCNGTAGANLQSALRARGGQARGCYERQLATNTQLAGKMTVQVKLSPSGSVCSASISDDTLGNAAVSSCVLNNFRSGVYPPPEGGCVSTAVPLNFVAKQ